MTSGRIEKPAILDVVKDFILHHTRPVGRIWIKNSSFYRAYCEWAEANQKPVVSSIAFGKVLSGFFEIPVVRRRIDNKQYTGRLGRWPCEDIRQFLVHGVDYL